MKIRMATIVFPAALCLCAVAGTQTDNSLPTQITTRDGKTYNAVVKQRVEPDGILVSYEPAPGGFGMAKLKFRDLPDDVQKKYGYDEKKAADFETQQVQATGQCIQTWTAEKNSLVLYRDLAELHRSLAGEEAASYAVALETNGAVSAQGFTRTAPSETVTNVVRGPGAYPTLPGYFLYQRPNTPPGQ